MFIEFESLDQLLKLIPKNDRSEARQKCEQYGGFNAFRYRIETRWVYKSGLAEALVVLPVQGRPHTDKTMKILKPADRYEQPKQNWLLATNEMSIYKAFQRINALMEKAN